MTSYYSRTSDTQKGMYTLLELGNDDRTRLICRTPRADVVNYLVKLLNEHPMASKPKLKLAEGTKLNWPHEDTVYTVVKLGEHWGLMWNNLTNYPQVVLYRDKTLDELGEHLGKLGVTLVK